MVRRKRDNDYEICRAERINQDRLQLLIEREVKKALPFVQSLQFIRCFPSMQGGVVFKCNINGFFLNTLDKRANFPKTSFVGWVDEHGKMHWDMAAKVSPEARAAVHANIENSIKEIKEKVASIAKAAVRSEAKKLLV
jgi:hypothetical protein